MHITHFLGDLTHLAAFVIIVFRIRSSRSCEGFSGKMQVLQMLGYLSRYWDIFYFTSVYSSIMKILCISFSFYVNYLIYIKYKETYEKTFDKFWIESIIFISITTAFCLNINQGSPNPEDVALQFGHFLNSASIMPQIYFCYQKQVKDVTVTYYIIALALYQSCYASQWTLDYFVTGKIETLEIYPGIIQIIFYMIYFALPRGDEKKLPEFESDFADCAKVAHSLLEKTLIKRSAGSSPVSRSSSSVYLVGMDKGSSTSLASITSNDSGNRY